MPVGERIPHWAVTAGSTATKQGPTPAATDWPSHKPQKRPIRCKVPKSSFLKNKSRRPGFVGSILSWSVGEKTLQHYENMNSKAVIVLRSVCNHLHSF